MIEQLMSLDIYLLRFFNIECQRPALDDVVPLITEYAHPVIFLAGLALFLFTNRKARLTGLLLMAGLTLSHYAVHGIKALIQRPRPFTVLADVTSVLPADGFSCPSGHTSAAFMTAFILTRKYGKWYIFYPLSVIVGITRMYLGVHYPSDVLAGAAVGTFIGFILVKLSDCFQEDILEGTC